MEIFATRHNIKKAPARCSVVSMSLILSDKIWLGRQDSNLGMAESKSASLVPQADDLRVWSRYRVP
jgi:hypothetical protein